MISGTYECSAEQRSALNVLVWFILFMTLLLILFISVSHFSHMEMSVNQRQTDAISSSERRIWMRCSMNSSCGHFKHPNNLSFKVDLLQPKPEEPAGWRAGDWLSPSEGRAGCVRGQRFASTVQTNFSRLPKFLQKTTGGGGLQQVNLEFPSCQSCSKAFILSPAGRVKMETQTVAAHSRENSRNRNFALFMTAYIKVSHCS